MHKKQVTCIYRDYVFQVVGMFPSNFLEKQDQPHHNFKNRVNEKPLNRTSSLLEKSRKPSIPEPASMPKNDPSKQKLYASMYFYTLFKWRGFDLKYLY
jgi:hypothetical protein